MILKTKKQEIEIKLKIKDIIKLTKMYNSENLQTIFFKGLISGDLDFLTQIIQTFSYSEDKKAFNTITDACDFLDDYIKENNKSIADLYDEFANEINDSGFFQKKMSEEELKSAKIGTLNIDIDQTLKEMVETIMAEKMKPALEEKFAGFKA